MTKKSEKTNESDELRELRAKRDALDAEKAELIRKKESVIAKHDANEKAMTGHITEARRLETEMKKAEKKELRGDITTEGLAKVKAACDNAILSFQKAEKTRHLAGQVINEIDGEIRELDYKLKLTLRKIGAVICKDIEKSADLKGIRETLIKIYVCQRLGGGGSDDWSGLVLRYFNAPETSENIKVKKEFLKENQLA
ncbi:MAG: hypothetical protein NMNS01_21730 [Nitrosomonas sp.]|nr:MAG: hypothetical protein NMNS01_21730 [Nitrosomonas sp.]